MFLDIPKMLDKKRRNAFYIKRKLLVEWPHFNRKLQLGGFETKNAWENNFDQMLTKYSDLRNYTMTDLNFNFPVLYSHVVL